MALTILIVMFVLVIWGAIVNNKTLNQRMEMLNRVFKNEKWSPTKYDFLDEVSYDKHFWYLLTFRDPMVLYPQRIQDLMK